MIKKLTSVITLSVLSGILSINPVFAKQATGTGFVKSIYNGGTGAPSVGNDWASIDATFTDTTLNCSIADGSYVLRIKDDDRGKRQFTTLLSAQLTGRKVTVSLDDTYNTNTANNTVPTPSCYIRWVKIQ